MIRIRIESNLRDVASALGKAQRATDVAIGQALNEGGDKVRTQVRRAMREQTSLVRLSSVTRRQATLRAYPGNLNYTIIFRRKPPTRLDEFRYTARRGPGGGVSALMWGKTRKFQRSFVTAGKGLLLARRGAARLPIRGFDGPNLAEEAVRGKVAETFLRLAPLIVSPIIAKRLARLI
jgi:hypothetical protein